jgi:uncharacterized protein (UPF0303 family)
MSIESDIARLKLQEEKLRPAKFDEADAWALGGAMRERALARALPLVIDIRIGSRPLFYVALPGTTPENPDWVRRKINTVYRFEASSYRIGLQYKFKGDAFDVTRGLEPLTYASAGGGFPLRISGLGVIGAVTVSGAPQRVDHDFVVECLSAHLGVAHAEIALSAESH